jgi:tetratricopeptide (TPR) repeat protein
MSRKLRHLAVLCLLWGLLVPSQVFSAYEVSQLSRVAKTDERELIVLVNQQIDELEGVLQRTRDKRRKTQIAWRLAQLHYEKYKTVFTWENRYHRELVAGNNRASKGVDTGLSKSILKKGLRPLERALKNDPNYPGREEIYFFLANSYEELGQEDRAENYYGGVVKGKKRSKYEGEARVSLGVRAFRAREFKKALNHFNQALRDQKMKSFPKALYYRAWCYKKLGRRKRGFRDLERVLKIGDAGGRYIPFKQEAISALPEFYASVRRDPSKAVSYFLNWMTKEQAISQLKNLSTIYEKQGRRKELQALQKARLGMSQNHTARISFFIEEAERYERQVEREKQVNMLVKAASLYGQAGKYGKTLRAEGEEGQLLQRKLKVRIRNISADYHKKAQDGNNRKESRKIFLKAAEDLYQAYVEYFPDAEDRQEVRFYLADVNLLQGDPSRARNIYRKILISSGGQKKIRKDSAEALLGLTNDAIKRSKNNKNRKKALELELIEAIDLYVEEVPNDKRNKELQLQAAQLVEQHRSKSEALTRYRKLSLQYPDSEQAKVAVRSALEILEDQKAYSTAGNLAKSFMDQKVGAKDAKFRQGLEDIYLSSQFKEIQKVENQNKYLSAAKAYEAIARKSKKKDVIFPSAQNAALNYQRAGYFNRADQIIEMMFKQFPEEDVAQNRMLETASLRFAQGRFYAASNAYWMFARDSRFPKSMSRSKRKEKNQQKLNALKNAFLINESLGESGRMRAVLFRMISDFPKKEITGDFLFKMAEMEIDQENYPMAKDYIDRYLELFQSGDRRVEGHALLGKMFLDIKDFSRAKNNFEKALQEFSRLSRKNSDQVDAAAKSKYYIAKMNEPDYKSIRLELPPKTLNARLKEKLQLIGKLTKNYVDVISVGSGDWAVAAYKETAKAYLDLADELEQIEAPASLSPSNKKVFEEGFQKEAKRVKKEALGLLRNGLNRGQNLEVASERFMNLWRFLFMLEPAEYALLQTEAFGGERGALMDPDGRVRGQKRRPASVGVSEGGSEEKAKAKAR